MQSVAVTGGTGIVHLTTQATDDRGVASVDYFADGSFTSLSVRLYEYWSK